MAKGGVSRQEKVNEGTQSGLFAHPTKEAEDEDEDDWRMRNDARGQVVQSPRVSAGPTKID
jgi:hypothetical protein